MTPIVLKLTLSKEQITALLGSSSFTLDVTDDPKIRAALAEAKSAGEHQMRRVYSSEIPRELLARTGGCDDCGPTPHWENCRCACHIDEAIVVGLCVASDALEAGRRLAAAGYAVAPDGSTLLRDLVMGPIHGIGGARAARDEAKGQLDESQAKVRWLLEALDGLAVRQADGGPCFCTKEPTAGHEFACCKARAALTGPALPPADERTATEGAQS